MTTDVLRADHLRRVVALAEGGSPDLATLLAAAGRMEAVRVYGTQSPVAVLWSEVEGHTAYLAGDALGSCRAWTRAAVARLACGEACDSAEVEASVDRAHHQWQQLTDAQHVAMLAPELTLLRLRVPGRRPGAVEAIRRRILARGAGDRMARAVDSVL
ncbi:hypothetical protein ABT121_06215 [Streptomyces sp. NPDC001928]|uniref:hypothetical protein n=1 Tax=Streptomyces sp. NPDC001928 TaxID=3154404 RepID=UPI00332C223B